MSFLSELKRRNVFKVAVAYAILSWIVLQVASIAFPALNLPDWTMTMLIVFTVIGFPFVMLFAWAFELTPEGIKATQKIDDADRITQQTGHKLNYLIAIAGLVLVLLVVVLDSYVLKDSPEAESILLSPSPIVELEPVTADSGLENVNPEKSIAVLAFADLSPQGDQGHLGDGIAEEILNKLAQVQDLQVAGRTSAFYYKDKNEDLRVIGETLGVAHILEGSIQKSGNQIRITAQLIKADDGFHLWSGTFNRDLNDIFIIQNEIAEAVTTALSITMNVGEFSRLGMTNNIEAYEEYLQAIDQLYIGSPESILSAIEYIEKAVSLDPDFAIAWLALSYIHQEGNRLLPMEQLQGFDSRIETARQRAREIAPEMVEVRLLAIEELINNHDYLEAEEQILKLTEQTGNFNAPLVFAYGEFLRTVGRSKEALPYLLQSKRLDPLNSEYALWIGREFLTLDRVDDALAEADRGLALQGFEEPIKRLRWMAAVQSGRRDGVLASSESMGVGRNVVGISSEIAELWLVGETDEALKALRDRLNDENLFSYARMSLAQWAAVLGEPELSLDIRQEIGDTTTIWMPYYSEVRKLPEFKDFVRGAGLFDYWQSSGNWADLCQPVGDDFECE